MRKIIWIILFLTLAVTIDFVVRRDIIKLDGFKGEIGGLLLKTDTKYSEKYTHSKFTSLKVGMTEQQLIQIIGEPLKKWEPYNGNNNFINKWSYIGFEYSESPSSTNYRLRQVNLNKGKVAEIISYFYLD